MQIPRNKATITSPVFRPMTIIWISTNQDDYPKNFPKKSIVNNQFMTHNYFVNRNIFFRLSRKKTDKLMLGTNSGNSILSSHPCANLHSADKYFQILFQSPIHPLAFSFNDHSQKLNISHNIIHIFSKTHLAPENHICQWWKIFNYIVLRDKYFVPLIFLRWSQKKTNKLLLG